MYKKPAGKNSLRYLPKNTASQSKLRPGLASKSLSKKQLPTFHTRSMIQFQDDEKHPCLPGAFSGSSMDQPIHQTAHKDKLHFVVALPHKQPENRKSPVAKYVKKDMSHSFSNLNLRATLKSTQKLELPQSKDCNYQLLVRMREVIDQLRQKENRGDEEMARLRRANQRLEQQNRELNDAIRKYQHREKELANKLRALEADKCLDHQIIIQSLKKVIDGQLQKIIELQRQKITAESCSLRSSKTAQSIEQYLTHESTPSFPPSSPHPRIKQYHSKLDSPVHATTLEDQQNHHHIQTFRKKPQLHIQQKSKTDDILMEIDNCLDSLSRRKRQIL